MVETLHLLPYSPAPHTDIYLKSLENSWVPYVRSLKFFIIKLLLWDQFRQGWIIWRLLQFIVRLLSISQLSQFPAYYQRPPLPSPSLPWKPLSSWWWASGRPLSPSPPWPPPSPTSPPWKPEPESPLLKPSPECWCESGRPLSRRSSSPVSPPWKPESPLGGGDSW